MNYTLRIKKTKEEQSKRYGSSPIAYLFLMALLGSLMILAAAKSSIVPQQDVVGNTFENLVHDIETSKRVAHTDDTQMTVVISSYKQPICLERMITLLRSCPVVAEIRVNWFVQDEDPHLYNEFTYNHHVPVIFDRYPDKLSYRFHPRNFTTEAVFSVDVDTYYSCDSLAKAFQTWKYSSSANSAVGFHGRYLGRFWYFWSTSFYGPWFVHNTVFITKGGITHRNMFNEFFKDEYKTLRDLVDEHMTAEDILMSMVLANAKAKIIMTCPEVHDICHVDCNQNKVGSLNHRTSGRRAKLMRKFYRHFGGKANLFQDTIEGSAGIVWQGNQSNVCMSMNGKQYDNTPHCAQFCGRNLICPSHVNG